MIVGTGNDSEAFFVHEDIICEKSPFFKAACSKNWIENQEKTVRLPEQEVEIFRMYLECVYREKVEYILLTGIPITMSGKKEYIKPEDDAGFATAFMSICKLWAAADFLGDTKTQNEIMDCIVGLFSATRNAFASIDAIKLIADCTPLEGGLHRWMIEFVAAVMMPAYVEKIVEALPQTSLVQLLKRLVAHKPAQLRTQLPRPQQSAKYHA